MYTFWYKHLLVRSVSFGLHHSFVISIQPSANSKVNRPVDPAQLLSLNFVLRVDEKSNLYFTVKILKTENVSILKRLIKEKLSPHLNHVAASELTVWKVSLPVDTITPELTADDVEAQNLHPVKKISSFFGEALVDEHVHILVQAPTGALHERFLDLS